MGILPVTQLHCVPCGLARGQSLDRTRKFKMGPKTFQKSTQVFSTKKPYLLTYKQLQISVSMRRDKRGREIPLSICPGKKNLVPVCPEQ